MITIPAPPGAITPAVIEKDFHQVVKLLPHKGARPYLVDADYLEIHFTDQGRSISGVLTPREYPPGLWVWHGDLTLEDGRFLMGPIGPGRYLRYNPRPSWVARAYVWEVRPWKLPRKGNIR